MRIARFLLMALVASLVGMGGGSAATAQSLDSMPGLQQAVVRAWIMPENTPSVQARTLQPQPLSMQQATPPASPAATPEAPRFDPATGEATVVLTLGAFRFDSEDAAKAGFAMLAQFVVDTSDLDASYAGGSRVELPFGDEGILASATQDRGGVPFGFLVSAMRDGNDVFLMQGTLIGLDPAAEATRLLGTVMETDPVDGEMQFSADGTSTGGVWDRLTLVAPVVIPGTEVSDTIVFPTS